MHTLYQSLLTPEQSKLNLEVLRDLRKITIITAGYVWDGIVPTFASLPIPTPVPAPDDINTVMYVEDVDKCYKWSGTAWVEFTGAADVAADRIVGILTRAQIDWTHILSKPPYYPPDTHVHKLVASTVLNTTPGNFEINGLHAYDSAFHTGTLSWSKLNNSTIPRATFTGTGASTGTTGGSEGIIPIASLSEATYGTITPKAVTPNVLKNRIDYSVTTAANALTAHKSPSNLHQHTTAQLDGPVSAIAGFTGHKHTVSNMSDWTTSSGTTSWPWRHNHLTSQISGLESYIRTTAFQEIPTIYYSSSRELGGRVLYGRNTSSIYGKRFLLLAVFRRIRYENIRLGIFHSSNAYALLSSVTDLDDFDHANYRAISGDWWAKNHGEACHLYSAIGYCDMNYINFWNDKWGSSSITGRLAYFKMYTF
jgi:hypothetical protein